MIFNFKFSLLVIQLSQKITLTCLNKNNNNLRFKFSHISYLIYIYFQVSLLEWRCEEDTIACGERVYTISYIRNKKLQSSQQHPYNFRTIFSNLIVLRVLSLTVFSPFPLFDWNDVNTKLHSSSIPYQEQKPRYITSSKQGSDIPYLLS